MYIIHKNQKTFTDAQFANVQNMLLVMTNCAILRMKRDAPVEGDKKLLGHGETFCGPFFGIQEHNCFENI